MNRKQNKIRNKKIMTGIAFCLFFGLFIASIVGILWTSKAFYGTQMFDMLKSKTYTESTAFQEQIYSDVLDILTYTGYDLLFTNPDGSLNGAREIYKGYILDEENGNEEVFYSIDDLLALGPEYGLFLQQDMSYGGFSDDYYLNGSIDIQKAQNKLQINEDMLSFSNSIDGSVQFYTAYEQELCERFYNCLQEYNDLGIVRQEGNLQYELILTDEYGNVREYRNTDFEEMDSADYEANILFEISSGFSSLKNAGIEVANLNSIASYLVSVAHNSGCQQYTLQVGINKSFSLADKYKEDNENYNYCRIILILSILGCVGGLIGASASGAVSIMLMGRVDGSDEIRLHFWDKWFFEPVVFVAYIAAVLLLIFSQWFSENILYIDIKLVIIAYFFIMLILLGGSLIRRGKAGILFRSFIIGFTISYFVEGLKAFAKKKPAWGAFAGLLSVIVFDSICIVMFYNFYDSFMRYVVFIVGFIINLLCFGFILFMIAQRRVILEGVEKIAEGDLSYKIDHSKMVWDDKILAERINNIGDGLNRAVEESVKSERMKTDLITNVSHDIKTPLTSIINYVDLLRREHIQNDRVNSYLDVLEQKSQRLRTLTEDLVEISQAHSGNLQLELSRINFVELVNQTNGEFASKFKDKNLSMIVALPSEAVYIMADGRRVWRILENLYNNVTKYALENTRVYIDVFRQKDDIYFVIKNISKSVLNFSAEELTERFIRGDSSRTTEGSGLGLSIAKTLTEIQQGVFEIYLDGDLFRVMISFKITEKI